MKKWHHNYAKEARYLLANRKVARARRPVDVDVDRNLDLSKNNLVTHITQQQNLGAGPDRNYVLNYLDRVQYLIGNNQ